MRKWGWFLSIAAWAAHAHSVELGVFGSLSALVGSAPIIVAAAPGYRVVDIGIDGREIWNFKFTHAFKGNAQTNTTVSVMLYDHVIPAFTDLRKEACILFRGTPEQSVISGPNRAQYKCDYVLVSNTRAILPAAMPNDVQSLSFLDVQDQIMCVVRSYLKAKRDDVVAFERELSEKGKPNKAPEETARKLADPLQ